MAKAEQNPGAAAVVRGVQVFTPGEMILATLSGPREKFWGALLELSALGLSMRGIELGSLEDFARQLKAGEAVAPAAVFFPMHRLERIELDTQNGDLPSVAQQFQSKTGQLAKSVFLACERGGESIMGGGAA